MTNPRLSLSLSRPLSLSLSRSLSCQVSQAQGLNDDRLHGEWAESQEGSLPPKEHHLLSACVIHSAHVRVCVCVCLCLCVCVGGCARQLRV